jgi:hypothetical protein
MASSQSRRAAASSPARTWGGDGEDAASGVGGKQRVVEPRARGDHAHRVERARGFRAPIPAEERESAGVVPRAEHIGVSRRGPGLGQHLVPLPEARERVPRDDAEAGEQRQRRERRVAHLRRGLQRRLDRARGAALHGGRGPQEVDVVRVVGHRVEALRAALRDVVLVREHGQLVALRRVGIAAHPLIDVRRHVHQVPGRRHQPEQPVGRRRREPCVAVGSSRWM